MASLLAVNAVCEGIRDFLDLRWKAAPVGGIAASFEVCSHRRAGELAGLDDLAATTVGIVLTRLEIDDSLRNHRLVGGFDTEAQLPVRARLVTFVAPAGPNEARAEQVLLSWTLRELLVHPTFTAAELPAAAGFDHDDLVQLAQDPLDPDDLRRLFDGLKAPLRLALGWEARVIPLEREHAPDAAPVLLRQFHGGST